MGTTIQITVDASPAIAQLSALRGAIKAQEAVHRVASNAAAVLIRGHLLARNGRSVRSNYWGKAAEAVYQEADATSGRVIIRHPGIAWHRHGGTIKAKPGKALAIPLRDSVHGMRAKERFPNKGDAFVWRHKNRAYLAARVGKAMRIFYVLLKSVSKGPDASVLPSDQSLSAAANAAVHELLRLAISRRHASQI